MLRYGNARELCLGLEVVTSSGDVWDGLTGLRKDNTGYDLRNLMIGSEGTLGIITAATLKLHPRPAAVLTAMAGLPEPERGHPAARVGAGPVRPCPHRFRGDERALARPGAQALSQAPPADRAGTVDGAARTLRTSKAKRTAPRRSRRCSATRWSGNGVGDVAVAASLEQANAMWHLRESIPLAQADEGPNVKHDISLPASAVRGFVDATDAALLQAFPGIRLVDFGHLGDGNLHYNVQCPAGDDATQFLARHEHAIHELVYDAVVAHGGSISAEHGIGSMKLEALASRKSPVALAMMRSIKRALDPAGVLNPGRVLAAE